MLCFQIPERQYIWTALSARAKAHAWADIENLLTAKVNLYWLIYSIINIYIVTLQMKKKIQLEAGIQVCNITNHYPDC